MKHGIYQIPGYLNFSKLHLQLPLSHPSDLSKIPTTSIIKVPQSSKHFLFWPLPEFLGSISFLRQVSLCCPGWSVVAIHRHNHILHYSLQLSNSWVPVILPPQPSPVAGTIGTSYCTQLIPFNFAINHLLLWIVISDTAILPFTFYFPNYIVSLPLRIRPVTFCTSRHLVQRRYCVDWLKILEYYTKPETNCSQTFSPKHIKDRNNLVLLW